jgi:hypothetical protein
VRAFAGPVRRPALLCVLLLLATLASCGREQWARRQTPPYQIGGAACLNALAARGVRTEPWHEALRTRVGPACRIDTPVRAAAGRTMVFRPTLETSCAMLLAWADLEPDLQRAAREHLGTSIRAVRHFGSYSCRGINGNAGWPSLHATARAFDVAGFEFADGRALTVAKDWDDGSRAERRFLRAARDAACRRLAMVLHPDSDRRHRDHIHVDLGPWRGCG